MISRHIMANRKMRCVLLGITAALALALIEAPLAWSQDDDDHAQHEEAEPAGYDEHAGHEGPIILDAEDMQRMGIVVAPVGPGTIRKSLRLPGEVVLNEDRVAHIAPRFDGIVREVRKRLGDRVDAGEVMAVIESNTSLQTYTVKSLIGGAVVGKHITLGEFVTTDSDVYVVADLSDVWVNIAVYARDQGQVAAGQEVGIVSNDLGMGARAVVSYVSPLVDERTRTALARAVLPNPQGRWRPGSFVTVEIQSGGTQVPVAVPNHAIETLEDQNVIFVQTDAGFAPREITIGRANGDLTEVTTGLQAGERIVVQGSFTLKAELLKDSFGEGHAH